MKSGKVDNILLLFNMFANRKRVTHKSIMEILSVSRRTVFRYINTLKLIGLPISWSNQYQCYRLSSPHVLKMSESYRVDEIGLIIYGLLSINEQVGKSYQNHIDILVKKIVSSQRFCAEDLVHIIRKSIPNKKHSDDLSKVLNWILITSADILDKEVAVEVTDNPDDPIVIYNSTIKFDKDWQIVGQNSGKEVAITTDDIISVKILS